ncbi:MAG: cytidine deaminase [Cytophagales bacterium]|nr:cytidine deaminase [Cytophagales bacterium]MDW8384651.1 cytidine deaminase [Flammeovirgaceae bacterium]
MQSITVSIAIQECFFEELPFQERELLQRAEQLTSNAYAPYSHFWVGCAILLENGTIIGGANQENAAYPSGLCAERTAFFHYGTFYSTIKIKAVAIAARRANQTIFLPISPCGACRQVMLEYENKQNHPIKLIMRTFHNKIHIVQSLSDLLPLKFDKNNL